jgi:predicted ATPase
MIKHLRKLNTVMFGKPTAQAYALNELAEAQRHLLVHQTAAEYNTHMAAFYSGVINRLTEYTKGQQ